MRDDRTPPPRLAILPPILPRHAPLEGQAIVHGCAAWWAARLTELGGEAQAIVQWVRGPEPGGVPTDHEVRTELARPGVDARYAVLPEYGARPGEPMVLLAARLLDACAPVPAGRTTARPMPLRVLGDWGFEPTGRIELDILGVTCELLHSIAGALGLECPDEDWRSCFGTPTPAPAVAMLRAMGCVELAARGHAVPDRAECLRALVRAMQHSPDLNGAAELFPRLTLMAIEDPEIDDQMLAEIWDTACAATCRMARSGWSRIPELLRLRECGSEDAVDDSWLVADGSPQPSGARTSRTTTD